jgi:hypothetical protein
MTAGNLGTDRYIGVGRWGIHFIKSAERWAYADGSVGEDMVLGTKKGQLEWRGQSGCHPSWMSHRWTIRNVREQGP